MDITTIYGHTTKYVMSIENNGFNPVSIVNIDIVNRNDLAVSRIYFDLINFLPLTIIGNTTIDLLFNIYSLSLSDLTTDVTFNMLFNIYDATDITSMISTSEETYVFSLVNENFWSDNLAERRSKLHRNFFKLPFDGFTLPVLDSNGMITVQKFDNMLDFKIFQLKYVEQFSLLMNSVNNNMFILGRSVLDENSMSLKYIIPENDRNTIASFQYNYGYMFFSEV